MADGYRVHYSIRGSGRDVTVQAKSSPQARRVVTEMFPRCRRNRCEPRKVVSGATLFLLPLLMEYIEFCSGTLNPKLWS